jgi:hypothetical protein
MENKNMGIFKSLCNKAFEAEIEDFDGLSGAEQREICKEFFKKTENEFDSFVILNSLFPDSTGYMPDKFSDLELRKKANKVRDSFNIELTIIGLVGPDMSCEFHPNGERWGDE